MMVGQNICPEQLLSIAERTIIEADTGIHYLQSFSSYIHVFKQVYLN